MIVTSKIKLDMANPGTANPVYTVQGDGNTRAVEIALMENGAQWQPDGDWEAAITYQKPDGKKGLYSLLEDGSHAITIDGSTATVILAQQMLTVPGTVRAAIVFNNQRLDQLTSFPFHVSVARNRFAGAQQSEDYIRLQWLEDKLDEYLRKAADSGSFDGAPGAPGHTPEYGVDYGTPEQISGIAQQAAEILQPELNEIKSDIAAVSAVCGTLENTEDGTVIQLTDCADRPLKGLRILGRTVQDGTPTPEAPVELVSVGDGGSVSVTVSDGTSEQRLTVSTPNGLPGIPVSSGGNYTDSTGQQWICDEVDFARGRLIKKVLAVRIPDDLNGGEIILHNNFHPYDGISRFVYRNTALLQPGSVLVSNRFPFSRGVADGEIIFPHGQVGQLNIQIRSDRLPTDNVAGLLAWAQEQPITILAQMTTPVETDLSEDELAAYAALRTNYPNTTIINDSGSWMEIGYQADTKLYIDKQFAEVRNAIVSLGGNI